VEGPGYPPADTSAPLAVALQRRQSVQPRQVGQRSTWWTEPAPTRCTAGASSGCLIEGMLPASSDSKVAQWFRKPLRVLRKPASALQEQQMKTPDLPVGDLQAPSGYRATGSSTRPQRGSQSLVVPRPPWTSSLSHPNGLSDGPSNVTATASCCSPTSPTCTGPSPRHCATGCYTPPPASPAANAGERNVFLRLAEHWP